LVSGVRRVWCKDDVSSGRRWRRRFSRRDDENIQGAACPTNDFTNNGRQSVIVLLITSLMSMATRDY
jgi:hypothetical protein